MHYSCILLLFVLSAAHPLTSRATDHTSRPNIVVFLTDDHSLLDSSVYGSRDVRTPNMQRLAERGMTFTQAFVASPTCAPSRAALLTGLMPARNGCVPNHSRARPEIKKLPGYFRELGYDIAAFGKVAHYGHGKHYGFENIHHEGFHDYRGIPAAVDFLAKRGRTKPLCLFVGTNWPHRPWPADAGGYVPEALSVPASHVDTAVTRAFRARYYHAVMRADEDLGAIHEAAMAHLGENTLFLLSSDHGAQWPFGKWTCYDAGIRVPLIAAWPGRVKAGTRTDAMVSWVDILPTLLAAAGGDPPVTGYGSGELDGRSFLPVLLGKETSHRDRVFATHSGDGAMNVYPMRSVRTASWKYVANLHPEFQFTSHIDRAAEADETDYWKSWVEKATTDARAAEIVTRYRQRPAEELYDLQTDPFELNNLALEPRHSARAAAMSADLREWMRKQGDQGGVFNKPVLLVPSDDFPGAGGSP